MLRIILLFLVITHLFVSISFATEIPAGPVSGDWYVTGNPYNINGEITVPTDSTLNIHPGVNVIFQGHYKLIVNGYLNAMGTESDSIHFGPVDTTIGWHGIRFIDAPDSSHLFYCSIRHGSAQGNGDDNLGGGIYIYRSNPAIGHSLLYHNYAFQHGGGIYIYDSNPSILACTFNKNTSSYEGGGIYCHQSNPDVLYCIFIGDGGFNYGGIVCDGSSSPIISHCTITEPMYGPGIACVDNSNPVIRDCRIQNLVFNAIWCIDSSPEISCCLIYNNTWMGTAVLCAGNSAPAITNCTINYNSNPYGGIIICADVSNPHVSGCTFKNNDCHYGGTITCLDYSSITIERCLIFENNGGWAGAVFCSTGTNVSIDHCTISRNTSMRAGGIYFYDSGNSSVTNTIIDNNIGGGGINFANYTDISITYCNLFNNSIGNFTGLVPPNLGELTTTNANGDSCDIYFNIQLNPLYENPSASDFHLQSGSPCIDAGDPDSPLDPDSTIADIGTFFYDQSPVNDSREIPNPTEFHLFQNYPNPFNPITIIPFQIPYTTHVSLKIYNILGQRVITLIDSRLTSGHHTVTFDATDLPSGIYFPILSTPTQTKTRKMVLLK